MSKRDESHAHGKRALRREVGRRIVQKRKRRGWSQAELARRLEVPRERVSKWERGENAPSLEDLTALSEALEVPVEELGIGCAAGESLSAVQLGEVVSHLKAIGRLLRPWLERRDGGAPGGSKAGTRRS